MEINNIQNPFSKKSNTPGRDWFTNFVKRNNLTLQSLEQLEMTRRTATADLFIVYGFYTLLEEELLMPPLFIFEGTNLWSTWKGTNDLPGTLYAVSEKGYMTSEIFS